MSAPEEERPRFGPSLAALNHANFRLFYPSYAVSLIGTWMQTTAMAWLVWRLTHSEEKLGMISMFGQLPNLFFAPMAGVLADRHSRRKLVIATQVFAAAQAGALAALTLWADRNGAPISPTALFWCLAGLASMLGVINAFDMPFRQSFVVELVGPRELGNAMAMNSFIFNFARIAGPALTGAILARGLHESYVFVFNAASYFVVIGTLLAIRLPQKPKAAHAHGAGRHLAEGFKFASRHAALREPLLLVGVLSLAGLPAQVLMPAIASKVFGGGPELYGILVSAIGAGALIGAFMQMHGMFGESLEDLIPRAGICFGLSLVAVSLSGHFWLSVALLLPTGAAMMMQTLGTNTLLQHLAPDRLRGRIVSIYTMMLLGFVPMGSYALGNLAERVGALRAVRLGGFCCLAAAVVVLSRLGKIKKSAEELRKLG